MIDIEIIRKDPARIKEIAAQKKVAVDIDQLLELDTERRALIASIDQKNQRRKEIAGSTKAGKPSDELIREGTSLKQEIKLLEEKLRSVAEALTPLVEQVPNIPTEDTPVGESEADNHVLRTVGTPPQFDFPAKEHWELGESLDILDNERAAKVTGTRFTYLKGPLVMLQFALIQHALQLVTDAEKLGALIKEKGLDLPTTPFIPIIPPLLVKPAVLQAMARLEPREERYHVDSDDLYLVGSAEHTLGSLHMEEMLAETNLPLRYVGLGAAFRREAGSYGKDVRGILRLHQFDKMEMESFSLPEHAQAEQELFVGIQESLMQSLGLPYQVVLKCTADMGTPDARAIDIETWMPGQNTYRETHTADLMTDYQSRRLKTRVKRESGETQFVHMNDATLTALGRTLIAIMENYQQADGSITVPEVLQQYVGFTSITKQ